MRRAAALIVVGLMVAACSDGAQPEQTEPPQQTTAVFSLPPSAPKGWSISVSETKYASRVALGDDLTVTMLIKNTGTATNPGTRLAFDGITDHFDLDECDPSCQDSSFLGTLYLDLPGLNPGKQALATVTFIATKLGRAEWTLSVFDAPDGDIVYTGQGTTVVSGG